VLQRDDLVANVAAVRGTGAFLAIRIHLSL
jgi:hypothetical protein